MKKEYQLIELYCTICQIYSTTESLKLQRQINNSCPKFTDEECVTIYLWGLKEQQFETKKAYNFIKDYFPGYFPDLPSYQAFNKRINFLADDFVNIANYLMQNSHVNLNNSAYIIDSMPIILANQKRSQRAKVASEICSKGYCASKNMFFHGVKLHAFCQTNKGKMPYLVQFIIAQASENDLPVGKRILSDIRGVDVFADKMYKDSSWEAQLKAENNINLFTPCKKYKGHGDLASTEKLYSKAVSSIRPPIESFFNWLQEKTHIQNASKVRSTNGLLSFVLARICKIFL